MRLMKLAGLAMLAVAVAAFAGAAPAAADESVVLCKANEETCKAESYAGEAFTATAEAALGFGELGTVKCSSSTMSRNTSGQISTLSFTGCSEGCSVKANGLPYRGELINPSGGNGVIYISNSGSGEPQLAVTCGGTECLYGIEALESEFKGGTPANVIVSKSMTRLTESFFCPKSAKWEGAYKFTTPSSAVYMVDRKIEGPVFCEVNKEVCPQKSVVEYLFADLKPESSFRVSKLSKGDVECAKAGFGLLDTADPFGSGPLNYKTTGLQECTHPQFSNCTLTREYLTLHAYLFPLGGGDGEISIVEGSLKEEPRLRIKCTVEKTPFSCLYATEEFLLEYEGGQPGTMQEVGTMTRVEGSEPLCPSLVQVQGSYEVVTTSGPSTEAYLTET